MLLENDGKLLPLRKSGKKGPLRVYAAGVDSAAVRRAGYVVVTDPAQADVAVMRLAAPFETLHPGYVFGAMQHEGSLEFRDGDPAYDEFRRVSAIVPTIVTVYLDRPAVLTPLKGHARAVLANFGISDDALMEVLAGRARPQGKLPFDLPSSNAAVQSQHSDVAHDILRPLYRFGYGRRF